MNILDTLSAAQLKAATSTHPRIACRAIPGAGKTRTLIARIADLIENRHVSPYSIMAITFTNKAAAEIEERLTKEIGPEKVRRMTLGTFHSVFLKMIISRRHSFGYSRVPVVYDESDVRDVMEQAMRELAADNMPVSKFLAAKIRLHQDLDTLEANSIHAAVLKVYDELLMEAGAIDFDLILYRFYNKLLEKNAVPSFAGELRQQYGHILVDEFQDTNGIQDRILREIDPDNLFVVGDENQSIYGFRGAKVAHFIDYCMSDETEMVYMNISYRSVPEILIAAENVINHQNTPIKTELYSEHAPSAYPAIGVEQFDDEEALYGYLCRRLDPALDTGILTRTNRQAADVSQALRRANIPHVLLTGEKEIWQEPVVRSVLAYLKLMVNPDDAASLRSALRLPRRDHFTPEVANELSVDCLRAGKSLPGAYRDRFGDDPIFPILAAYDEVSESLTLDYIDGIITALDLETYFRELNTPNKFQTLKAFRSRVEEWYGMSRDRRLVAFLAYVATRDLQDKLITSKEKIRVMTTHAAKGLEFDTVFSVGLNEGIFPNHRADIEEERRLFFVNITRAANRFHALSLNKIFRGNFQVRAEISRFIDEMNINMETVI